MRRSSRILNGAASQQYLLSEKETIIHEFNRTLSSTQNAFPVYATSKK